jgi:hypothetical protein
MCRKRNSQAAGCYMLQKQVTTIKVQRKIQFNKHKKVQKTTRMDDKGKATQCHLGMLLPSKDSLAAEAVAASVYWINACQKE